MPPETFPALIKPVEVYLGWLLDPVVQPAGVVRFQPPDDAFRGYVSTLAAGAVALNVYLAELRESRRLRSSDSQSVETSTTDVPSRPPAAYLDCHYLITAWSRAPLSAGLDPTRDEHDVLYQVAATLLSEAPLNLSRYSAEPGAPPVPPALTDIDLYTDVAPPDESPKLRDFWATMGVDSRWKPAVHLVITLPVVLPQFAPGPMVRSMVSRYIQGDATEVLVDIGGMVLNQRAPVNGQPAPVVGAAVSLTSQVPGVGKTATTDEQGRYLVTNLAPGAYDLAVEAAGLGPTVPRQIVIPAAIADYDVTFE